MKSIESKIVDYKETVLYWHLLFWAESQRRVKCHI